MIFLLEFWIGGLRSSTLTVSAISKKLEPAKVFLYLFLPKSLLRFEIFFFVRSFLCVIELVDLISVLILDIYDACGFQVVPQADRVLVRLEELPEVSLRSTEMANAFVELCNS